MPSPGGLTNDQIADVLSFVRSDFGEKSSEVSADEVKKLRAANLNREKPWTVEPLGK
jgi:mono/diheme cytochrome c family protein